MRPRHFLVFLAAFPSLASAETPDAVSYYRDVRPIFQANCQGCHQPSKAKGDYVMTAFEGLLQGGESGAAVVPRDVDASYLFEQIVPGEDGSAEMPPKDDPLSGEELAVVRRWIEEGAADDTPENARSLVDADNPPVYEAPPVVTAIDYSPDGKLLAVSGFHEVLVHRADGSGLHARLIGLSQRIESLAFSPDGTRLAVTGGLPGRMGEVQVWDVAKSELVVSVPVTFDTVYGVSWSPDGKSVAFGCTDNSVRIIDAKSGKETFFNAAHSDWALATAFSADGKTLVSVGRDQTVKVYDVAAQRFIDNVTSITPGALKGGINAVGRHPVRDEVIVGGADGVPQIFRLTRIAKRVIGDNSNLVRTLPGMTGRIFGAAFSPDGTRAAAASSLDGDGFVSVYSTGYDPTVSEGLKKIFAKRANSRNGDEKAQVEAYQTADIALGAAIDIPDGALYALSFRPDGNELAAAGADGTVHFIDPAAGEIVRTLTVTDFAPAAPGAVVALKVEPSRVVIDSPFAYAQFVVTAELGSGEMVDVTGAAEIAVPEGIAELAPGGLVRSAGKDGEGMLRVAHAGIEVSVPVAVSAQDRAAYRPDYVRDVNPVISKMGCNAGTCHGSKDGKNGFKLSLRGYDTLYDLRAFTDDHASRRVNFAFPDESLMLLKATAAVPHEGKQLTKVGADYYEVMRAWIAQGAQADPDSEKVASIALHPVDPVVQTTGATQQLRVVASYPDGSTRDVTQEAFIESGNTDVAAAGEGGLITTLRRGEAPVLVRYEGVYAATTVTVMGDRDRFPRWEAPLAFNAIDPFVIEKWKRTKTLPSGLASDEEFVRRVYLDLTGLPPTVDQLEAFLADAGGDVAERRAGLVAALVGSDAYVDHWSNKWADLLQVNGKFLARAGAAAFRDWIRTQVKENVPYDAFARSILTATGSNKENPAASYYKILRTPEDTMENTTHLFLATRFNCNKCHDHPFERWTQNQYYEMTAFFAQVGLERDPASGDKKIGGTAVEGAKPLYEKVVDRGEGETLHERTGEIVAPAFPYQAGAAIADGATRREELAAWITAPGNRYFARSYVNRLWGYLLGIGIIDPIDDIRAGNPPSNPELLDFLTDEFVRSGFDVQHMVTLICTSRTYQLSVATNRWNEDDAINFSHAMARRLPAEVLYDAIYEVTGTQQKIPGVPAGTRAAALPDVGVKLADGFLGNLGRPSRESACECERSSDLQLGPVMALISGPTVGNAISAPDNAIAKLAASELTDRDLVDRIFLRVLSRRASDAEADAVLAEFAVIRPEHDALVAELERYAKEIAPSEVERVAARGAAIVKANDDIAAYEKEIAPREAELDREQEAKVAKVKAELATHRDGLRPVIATWERGIAGRAQTWETLALTKLKSTNGATFEAQEDGSYFVVGKEGKTDYTFDAETGDGPITGVRLEVLADERLPAGGPGRAKNGNFVLGEIVLQGAAAGAPDDQLKPLKFLRTEADFSQESHPVANAIDGVLNKNEGWATSPRFGETRTAVFELEKPAGDDGKFRLSLKLNQHWSDGSHSIGRFRVSVTRAAAPITLDPPDDVAEIIALVGPRTEAEADRVIDYYADRDAEQLALRKRLAEAGAPRPTDPGLVQHREHLAKVSEPFVPDPTLTRLQGDVELSGSQVGNLRLTAAQDLAWALINTPSFLFNR